MFKLKWIIYTLIYGGIIMGIVCGISTPFCDGESAAIPFFGMLIAGGIFCVGSYLFYCYCKERKWRDDD